MSYQKRLMTCNERLILCKESYMSYQNRLISCMKSSMAYQKRLNLCKKRSSLSYQKRLITSEVRSALSKNILIYYLLKKVLSPVNNYLSLACLVRKDPFSLEKTVMKFGSLTKIIFLYCLI